MVTSEGTEAVCLANFASLTSKSTRPRHLNPIEAAAPDFFNRDYSGKRTAVPDEL